jgi:hypothetical protein
MKCLTGVSFIHCSLSLSRTALHFFLLNLGLIMLIKAGKIAKTPDLGQTATDGQPGAEKLCTFSESIKYFQSNDL